MQPRRVRFTTDPSLKDHRRVGKRLIAPWKQRLGTKLTYSCWHLERLPEVVWIAEMVHALGTADSLDSLCTVLECAFDAQREGDVTVPLLASYWAGARDETKNHVRKTLRVNDELGLVGSGLQTLSSLYPGVPHEFPL